jgi:hypothetical protein
MSSTTRPNPNSSPVPAYNLNSTSETATLQPRLEAATSGINTATSLVNSLTAPLQTAGDALAAAQAAANAHPKDAALQKQVVQAQSDYDSAVGNLSFAKGLLDDAVKTMQTLVNEDLPRAKEKDRKAAQDTSKEADKSDSAQAEADKSADAAKDLQAAQALQATVDKKLGSAKAKANALGVGADSYGAAPANGSGPNSDGAVDPGVSGDGTLAVTDSGASLDAGNILSQAGIDPKAYLEAHHDEFVKNSKLIDENMYQSLLKQVSKKADGSSKDGSDAVGDGKGVTNKGKTAALGVGAGGVGATGATAATPALGAGATGTTTSTPTAALGIGGADGRGAGTTDTIATVDPSNLSAMEIMMLVMLEATDELNKEIQSMGAELQKATEQKNKYRQQLNANNQNISYDVGNNTQASSEAKAIQTNLQNDLDSIGSDTQMMQMRLQNLMQMQQQFVQGVSNLSKSLNDTSMAILRHIGS